MKKSIAVILCIALILIPAICFAAENNTVTTKDITLSTNTTQGELVKIKETSKNQLAEYEAAYGSAAFGFTAYILHGIRIYSIPFCFLGIAIGAIYQYVLGIRKLDTRDKGFNLMIAFITILVICQVLPLVFAIVVKSWRG